MPAKGKKTGVKNVDIGGAYKLNKLDSEQKASDQDEPVQTEESGMHEEDIDAELEALAMAYDPNGDGSQDAADVSKGDDMQIDTVNELPSSEAESEHEDIDAELQALLEEADDAPTGNDAEAQAPTHPPDTTSEIAPSAEAALTLPDESEDPADLDQPDGDETEAEDVDEALAALDQLMGTQAEGTSDTPVTEDSPVAQVSRDAPAADAQSEAANASASEGSTSQKQSPAIPALGTGLSNAQKRFPSPAAPTSSPGLGNTQKQASRNATPAAGLKISASTSPAMAPETTQSKPVIKKRQLPNVAAKQLSVPATSSGKVAATTAKLATAKNAISDGDKENKQLNTPAASIAKPTLPAAVAGSAVAAKPSAGRKLVTKVAKDAPADASGHGADHTTAMKHAKAPLKVPAKPAAGSATNPAAPAKASTANGASGKGNAANAAPKAPRAKNAFMFFSADKRGEVKASTPGASMGDIAKALGEMWKGFCDEDKKRYQDLADADKERVAKLKAELPPVPKPAKGSQGAAAKNTTAAKVPRAKTAYLMFCEDRRAEIKAANPEAGFGDIGKLLAAAWKECNAEVKAQYQQQNQAEKMKMQATSAADTLASVKHQKPVKACKAVTASSAGGAGHEEDELEEAAAGPSETVSMDADLPSEAGTGEDSEAIERPTVTPAKQARAQGNRAAAGMSPVTPAEQARGQAEGDEDTDDEADREAADWEMHPAEAIIGHTFHNKYMVKRKGLDFTEYGLVDARAAKRQCLGGDIPEPKVPISLEMMDEYEAFCKAFKRSVHEHQDQGNLDLDNIGQGSALEMCYYLGKLQENNYLLSKAPKKKGDSDVMIRVPMLGTSMVVQRVVNVERRLRLQAEVVAAEKSEEVERLKGELTVLQMVAQAAQKQQDNLQE